MSAASDRPPGTAAQVARASATVLPRLAAGAAAGAIVWTCAILLGIPLLAGFDGHDFTIPALLLGALLGLTRVRSALYVLAAALVLVTAIVAYTPLVERPVHSLVRRDPAPGVQPGAVVVLGADVTTDSLLYDQSLDRMLSGIELVKRGAVPVLVVPGNAREERGRRIPATPDQLRLVALAGIATDTLLVTDSVYSTRDEAVRALELLRPLGIRRIYVVTSPAHTGRACRTFERVGFTVTCTPSISRDIPFAPGTLYRSRDRLTAFRWWLYEQFAWRYYHARGWI